MARIDDMRPAGGYQGAKALDPLALPELYDGVLPRRTLAFVIDALLIGMLTFFGYIAIGVIGILTLGLGWLLFPVLFPLVALGYNAFTLGGPASATPGMRLFGLEMRSWDGQRMYALLAALHALLFWFSVSLLTPLVLLVAVFNERRRLLHDIVLGTVLVNSGEARRAGI